MDPRPFAHFSRKFAELRAELAAAGIDCTLSFCTPPGATGPVACLLAGTASADLTAARRQLRRCQDDEGAPQAGATLTRV